MARDEFAAHVRQATETEVKAVREEDGPASVYIGDTAFARRHGIVAAALAEEEWIVRSVDDALVLVGGGRRGTLYAVYHYLEDVLGVRWYAPGPGGTVVPKRTALPLKGLALSGKPAFRGRVVYTGYPGPGEDPIPGVTEFLARNRAWTKAPCFGGSRLYGGVGDCHTMYSNLGKPDEIRRLFKEHPEYFPMNERGERFCDLARAHGASQSQLCLTNPDLRKLWIDRLRTRIRDDIAQAKKDGEEPPVYYSIDQNDCYDGFCRCPGCAAVVAHEGSNGGLMLDFANAVAAALEDEAPHAIFKVMAGHSVETAPRHLKARRNVAVQVCDTTSNMILSWREQKSRHMLEKLAAWSAAAPRLALWDYSVTYGSQSVRHLPTPVEWTFGDDLRDFAAHKGDNVFIEHEFAVASDFRDAKLWCELKLLENPAQDVEALLKDFTDGMYGPAGCHVLAYRRLLRDRARAAGANVTWFPSLSSYAFVDAQTLKRAYDCRAAALATVRDDPVRRAAVDYAFLSLDRLALVRSGAYNRQAAEAGFAPISVEKGAKRYERIFRAVMNERSLPSGYAEEKSDLGEFLAIVRELKDLPVPAEFKNVPADALFLFPATRSSVFYRGFERVADGETPAGEALQLTVKRIRANPVPVAPAAYSLDKFAFPVKVRVINPFNRPHFYGECPDRFASGAEPKGYRWYKCVTDATLGLTTEVSPFPGCSLVLDGVVSDNSELGQKYDVWVSLKVKGVDYFKGGAPADDVEIFFDQLAVVRKTKNAK